MEVSFANVSYPQALAYGEAPTTYVVGFTNYVTKPPGGGGRLSADA